MALILLNRAVEDSQMRIICFQILMATFFVISGAFGVSSAWAQNGEIVLQPARWSFPGRCESILGRAEDVADPEIEAWRKNAIEQIRRGLNPKEKKIAQLAIIDMSPFIPSNLEEVIESLRHGMVALHQGSKLQPGQYFEFTPGVRQPLDAYLPHNVNEWAQVANQFVSDLVAEAVAPFYSPGVFVKKSEGQAKIAVGGTSYTLSDSIPHEDGNSFLTMVFNAAGEITTDYYLYREQKNEWHDGRTREERFGSPIRAPKHSLIIFPGREWGICWARIRGLS